MSDLGYPPHEKLDPAQFYSRSLREPDASKRRRLFANARQSNLCCFQIYVFAAEIEEEYMLDSMALQGILRKGVVVFQNPSGQGAHCDRISQSLWLQEAQAVRNRGHLRTADALIKVLKETF
ncbi:hypothetical protein BGX28_007721 [Mortierella sp. GBA30]|nr:hypothetical protein BGX28_007721 [Mortierella sp. GBA30]